MNSNTEIVNAQITDITLGYEEHGILTFGLTLDIANARECVFGMGYALDNYDEQTKKRYCHAHSMELIAQIIKVVGVSNWESLKGKYIRVVINDNGKSIKEIGNIMKDDWFNIDDFLHEVYLKQQERSSLTCTLKRL